MVLAQSYRSTDDIGDSALCVKYYEETKCMYYVHPSAMLAIRLSCEARKANAFT